MKIGSPNNKKNARGLNWSDESGTSGKSSVTGSAQPNDVYLNLCFTDHPFPPGTLPYSSVVPLWLLRSLEEKEGVRDPGNPSTLSHGWHGVKYPKSRTEFKTLNTLSPETIIFHPTPIWNPKEVQQGYNFPHSVCFYPGAFKKYLILSHITLLSFSLSLLFWQCPRQMLGLPRGKSAVDTGCSVKSEFRIKNKEGFFHDLFI